MAIRRRWIITAATILAAAAAGCSTPADLAERTAMAESGLLSHDGQRFGRIYRYWPEAQVYHSSWQDRYYWQDSAGRWRSNVHLPETIALGNSAPIYVTLYSNRPDRHHAVVLAQHPPQDDYSNLGHAAVANASADE